MKTIGVLAIWLITASGVAAQDIGGLWQTEPGDSGGVLHVAIAPCGAEVCGTIQSAFAADGTRSADYPHLGKPIIWDMAADGAGQWKGGSIWAPDRDKVYGARMEFESADRLKVSGCVAGGLICRGQVWLRVR